MLVYHINTFMQVKMPLPIDLLILSPVGVATCQFSLAMNIYKSHRVAI
jgi:hypothetical protein